MGTVIKALSCLTFLTCVSLAYCVTSDFLTVPLFEVGGLWVNATLDMGSRLLNAVFIYPDFSSPWTYLGGAFLAFGLYQLAVLLFVPIDRTRMLGEVGYIPESKMSMKDMVNIVRKRRQVGDVPPCYPNGWFSVIESRDLKRGEAKTVGCLGQYSCYSIKSI